MIPDDYLAAFTLPTIQNHVSRDVIERAPWGGEATGRKRGTKKTAVRKWDADAGTHHVYYSMWEGEVPTLRVSKENPARIMRAVIVDYDCYAMTDDVLEATLAHAEARAHCPAFISRSPSGGVHALWLLQEPIWVGAVDVRRKMLGWLKKYLKLDKFLPGFDSKVWEDTMLYFSCGHDWQGLDGELISAATIGKAFNDVASKADFKGAGISIPLEIVAAEVEARYPGRWPGEFSENSRGPRFWDESGDALSVIVKPEGLLCYTGEKNFLDWRALLGEKFVAKYIEDRIGGAASCAWFDGGNFWVDVLGDDGKETWVTLTREDLKRKLKVEYKLSEKPEVQGMASEVDHAIHTIVVTRRVKTAGPWVPRKPGIIYDRTGRHLNVADVHACPPMEGEVDGDAFPWIWNFLWNSFTRGRCGEDDEQLAMAFAEGAGSGIDPQEQLWRFLAWFQRGYLSVLNYEPALGQILVLAGEPSAGKTLMADCLVGGAMGNYKDASRFLMGESHFNKNLYRAPLWVVNDATAAAEETKKKRYHALVKRTAANPSFEMEAKNVDQIDVSWRGRLIITCNVDDVSIQVMPALDMSMEDKVLALRMWGVKDEKNVKEKREVERVKGFGVVEGMNPEQHITAELPAFLAWLISWAVPSWVARDARFGYDAWCHPSLKAQSESVVASAGLEEILGMYLRWWFKGFPDEVEWRGNATELLEEFQSPESPVKVSTRTFSRVFLGRGLGQLMAGGSKRVYKRHAKNGNSTYIMPRADWLDG